MEVNRYFVNTIIRGPLNFIYIFFTQRHNFLPVFIDLFFLKYKVVVLILIKHKRFNLIHRSKRNSCNKISLIYRRAWTSRYSDHGSRGSRSGFECNFRLPLGTRYRRGAVYRKMVSRCPGVFSFRAKGIAKYQGLFTDWHKC